MTGPAQPAVGEKSAGDAGAKNDQGQNGGDGNDAGKGPKRDPLYADLPDDHPLVKRHEALKTEVKELKPKAKIVDDAEAAKRTDAEKIAALQAENQTLTESVPGLVSTALREHLVELHGIEADDAELFLTGGTPELLLKQVTALLEKSGSGPKRGNHVRREGAPQNRSKPDDTKSFLGRITDRGQ